MSRSAPSQPYLVLDALVLVAAAAFAVWVLAGMAEVRTLRADLERRVGWLAATEAGTVPEIVRAEVRGDPALEAALDDVAAFRAELRWGARIASVRLGAMWSRMNVIALVALALTGLSVVLLMVSQRQRAALVALGEVQRARIAELVEARNRLAEQERLEDRFVATVSHELRTPLTAILGGLGLYERLPPERAGEVVVLARRNAERLLRIVNDLLDLKKLGGEVDVRLDPVTVAETVHAAVDLMAPVAERAGVPLEVRADESVVIGDPDRLTQVWTNLLANAVRVSPPGVPVLVEVAGEGRVVTVRVEDGGPGVAAGQAERIFQPFVQGDSGRGGTGLGLPIARAFLRRMGGELACVDGRAGGLFVATLPAVQGG